MSQRKHQSLWLYKIRYLLIKSISVSLKTHFKAWQGNFRVLNTLCRSVTAEPGGPSSLTGKAKISGRNSGGPSVGQRKPSTMPTLQGCRCKFSPGGSRPRCRTFEAQSCWPSLGEACSKTGIKWPESPWHCASLTYTEHVITWFLFVWMCAWVV